MWYKGSNNQATVFLTKSYIFIVVICFLLFASSIFTSYGSAFRYIKYAILPILIAMIFFLIKQLKIDKLIFNNLKVYVVIIVANLIISLLTNQISYRFFEEVILIILPLCVAFVIVGIRSIRKEMLLTALFYTYASSYILYFSNEFLNVSKLISNIIIALKFSIFPTESWHAFPFGLFSLYFIIEKKKYHALSSIILFVFAFKRISFVAFLIALSIFLWFVIKKISFNKKKVFTYFMLINISLLGLLFFFINGSFSRLIYKHTGLNVNHFSQGRFKIYNDTLNHFKDDIWFGSSLGSTHLFIDKRFENISFLHSDILKIIIEFGLISFVIWLFAFLYLNLTNVKAVPIVLYMNVLFLSDNVFIYFDTLLLFYIIISKFHQDVQKI